MVLLKNEHHLLPVAKNLSRIHVAGTHGNNVGYQCGGWTVTWQGGSGAITTGTTILEGIQQAVSSDTEVTYSKSGSGASGADVGIVVIGEIPYAEMLGDRDNLDLSLGDQLTLFRVKSAGIPVVAVLISGRPMIIEPLLEYCDAFIAAWLPGTEGQGVADVLFGDYNPTGKLSHSWPRTMSQIPLNIGDPQYDPLFPYGYGLSY
jgi:beta-glucosidase